MELVPYPSIYCPQGVEKPAHCPHTSILRPFPSASPDGGEGIVYGPRYEDATKHLWRKVPAGWYILLQGHLPQHLVRLDTSPRILRWHIIDGVDRTHRWRVPVLLTPADPADPDNEANGYVGALDRVWMGDGWAVPRELAGVQRRLLAVMHHVALDDNLEKRNAEFIRLVIDILALGHHVSDGEIIAGGWLSELMQARVILAAADRMSPVEQLDAIASGEND